MKMHVRHGMALVVCAAFLGLSFSGIGARAEDASVQTAPTAVPQKRPDFDVFRIIVERNIFDPTRKPGGAPVKDAPPPADAPQQTVRLMGTWLRDDHALALFEGSGDVPREGLEEGASIAGYRIAEVRTDAVVLANDQGKIELHVGAGLARKGEGTWAVVENPVTSQPTADSAKATESKQGGEAAGQQTTPGNKAPDDALEKLRERRRKEMGS
jgi:hypothetical protein